MFGFKRDTAAITRENRRLQERGERQLNAELATNQKLVTALEEEMQRLIATHKMSEAQRVACRIAELNNETKSIQATLDQRQRMAAVAAGAQRTADTMASAKAMGSTLERVARTVQPEAVAQLHQNIERSKDQIEMAGESLSELFQADDEDMIGEAGETDGDRIFREALEASMPSIPMSQVPSSAPSSYVPMSSLESRLNSLGGL